MNIKQLNSVLIAAGLLVAVNCYTIDPDEDRNVPQIIESRGFIAESHYVTTEDGYILTVHRIVNPDFRGQELKPVLMQHGLLASSVDFIINSPDGYLNDIETTPSNNLGFVLAKRGFDVWLGNSRGNIYSANHTSIPVNKKRFWQFTFDEMIKYDLPSTIDYVRNHTQSETIAYVGHSQGTVIMFGLLSTQPKYNDIIKPYIALAPVTTCSHIKSPIKYLAYDTLMVDYFKWRGGPFLPPQKWIKDVSDKFCPFKYGGICADVMFLLGGFDGKQMNVTRSPVYIAHTPPALRPSTSSTGLRVS
ncbi:Lipase member M [Halotydeus destructor]|nr:Lipase member M [Halotydeus destructor]